MTKRREVEQLKQMVRDGAMFAIHEPAGAEVAREIRRWAGAEYNRELTPDDIELQLARGRGEVCKHGGLRRKCEVCEVREEAAAALRRACVESFVEGYLAGIECYHDQDGSAQKAWDNSEMKRNLEAGKVEPWLVDAATRSAAQK